jgi:hypothetical protein
MSRYRLTTGWLLLVSSVAAPAPCTAGENEGRAKVV